MGFENAGKFEKKKKGKKNISSTPEAFLAKTTALSRNGKIVKNTGKSV